MVTEEQTTPRRTLVQHATTMMLYISIVLLAELAAIPSDHDGGVHGPTGWTLIALIWGTTIGLALAHYFAFTIAVHGLSHINLNRDDRAEAFAEIGGAAAVAIIASIPVLLFSPAREQEIVPAVLVLLIGTIAFGVERANGHSRKTAFIYGIAALVIGLLVVSVKEAVAYH
ncbi:MAG TPA: hypothetical protein VL856_17150 [Acidimicrobiia bacterium]|jgi:hypothetical protein|nr:hypothetical protein [Acidimicrobiia bacterium]